MTTRERNLLLLFFIVLGGSGLLLGLGSYWEELNRLDSDFVGLQKRVVKAAQASAGSKMSVKPTGWSHLNTRFFDVGPLPTPLALAAEIQTVLKDSGLGVQESRILETGDAAHWVSYMAEGSIISWFKFLNLARQKDPKILFRSLTLVAKPGFVYAISFEAGHVVLP